MDEVRVEDLRKSMSEFRQSIYGGDEVDFIDVFRFDMDEDDHREILSVMGGSLSRLPGSLKDDVLTKFLAKHPELKDHIEEEEKERSTRESFELDDFQARRWTEFHQEFVRELQSLVSTFSICDPDKLLELVCHKQRPNYEVVRALAIQKLGSDINKCLYMIYDLTKSSMGGQSIKITNLEHFHLFSWTEDRFIARRQLGGIAWLSIFEASLSEAYLEAFKLQVDIVELARLLKPILMSFYSENTEYGTNAVRMIDDAHKLLNMHNTIQHELEQSITYLCEKINTITNISLQRRSQGHDVIKNFLELETVAAKVRDPIENRYHLRYSKERVTEWKDYYEMKEMHLKVELQTARRKYSTEMYCFRLMLQSLYLTIDDYKTRIARMSDEYDRRFNEMGEKNIKLKSDIDKMKLQREFLEAEIEYMKSRVLDILTGVGNDYLKKSKRKPKKHSQSSLLQKPRSSVLSFRKKKLSLIK